MIKRMSIKKYHETDGLSKSMMDKLAISPAHLKASMEEPQKETEAMLLGSLFHTLVLEPKKFDAEYVIMPQIDRRTSNGKRTYAEIMAESTGKTVITQEQFSVVQNWVNAVFNHPQAKKFLTGKGRNEVSIFWTDELTGELCKARPDRIKDGYIIDLKTAISANPDDFTRKAFDLNYHIQAGWFKTAYENEFKAPLKGFIFVVVEKSSPYNVVVYEATEGMIEAGLNDADKLLQLYHHCKQTGNWYGYDGEKQDVQMLDLPNWAYTKYQDLFN